MSGLIIALMSVIFAVFTPLLLLRLAKFLCEKFDWEIFFIQKLCCVMGWHWKVDQIGPRGNDILYKCSGCDKIGTMDEYEIFYPEY
jgi:hypothetical protein